MSFDNWVEQRMEQLRKFGALYAQAKANVEHLEEYKKTKLALLMKEAELQGHKTSAAQEREARASDEYIELLEGLKEAVEAAEKYRWELEIAKLGVEVWRTRESTKRAEMKGYAA